MSVSTESQSAPSSDAAGYRHGAAVLSVGIAATGVVTYAYFALASHALTSSDYGGIALLWSAVFVVVSVLYRPVEQLLSRTIADHEARGITGTEHLRVAAIVQEHVGQSHSIPRIRREGNEAAVAVERRHPLVVERPELLMDPVHGPRSVVGERPVHGRRPDHVHDPAVHHEHLT